MNNQEDLEDIERFRVGDIVDYDTGYYRVLLLKDLGWRESCRVWHAFFLSDNYAGLARSFHIWPNQIRFYKILSRTE